MAPPGTARSTAERATGRELARERDSAGAESRRSDPRLRRGTPAEGVRFAAAHPLCRVSRVVCDNHLVTALYRTYRPLDFTQVVGQEAVVRTLRNAI